MLIDIFYWILFVDFAGYLTVMPMYILSLYIIYKDILCGDERYISIIKKTLTIINCLPFLTMIVATVFEYYIQEEWVDDLALSPFLLVATTEINFVIIYVLLLFLKSVFSPLKDIIKKLLKK